MKKALSLLLCLLLLAALAPRAGAEDVTEIRDAAGLAAMAEDPAGSYALAADIDLAGVDWTPVAFSGKLDGRGHTIYNLSVTRCGAEVRTTRDGNLKPYETVFAGLFSTLENAEVRDLSLRGAYLSIESNEHCFAALLAGYIDHSAISGCAVEGRAEFVGRAVMVGLGGVAGYGCGSITDCKAEVELFFEDRLLERRCEQFMGGVLSCGVADIERCTVRIEGYDSCHGYVHNGGLVGMYYLCGMDYPYCSVSENYVGGFIRFFEANTDRRAYCMPYRGEYLTGLRRYEGNSNDFQRLETFDYRFVLRPESCEDPDVAEEITPPGCDSWGFTRHECRGCGHSWTDSYTPPEHLSGDWESVEAPSYTAAGLERRVCTRCGAVLEERELPALIATESCALDRHEAALHPGETIPLRAEVGPADAADRSVRWSSSDESVAVVDEKGVVTALDRGRAEIRAATADGFCSDVCVLNVTYTFGQWLRQLFG
ncbi:MAG: Ig-like domain-containing protein [Oscillospiraceae bacterium]|nr:Ig-like domain-containing protein [Oscillospiraceae bacterium]